MSSAINETDPQIESPIENKQRRPRRKKLPRIQDWDDGVARILSWPGMQGHNPMFGPAISIGHRTGALTNSSQIQLDDSDRSQEGNQKRKNRKKKVYFLDADGLNRIRPPALLSVSVSFALQPTEGGAGLTYERLIYEHGLVLTRNNSWHDVLNALTWFYLPRGKRALNRLQCAASDAWADARAAEKYEGRGRSPLQSLLAHFDECGGVLILPPAAGGEGGASMSEMLQERDWTGLFHKNRQRWVDGDARMVVFGHGLLEQGLVRVPTMVANSLVFVLGDEGKDSPNDKLLSIKSVNCMNENDLVEFVDMLLENYFDDFTTNMIASQDDSNIGINLNCPTFTLVPVPILGIPGWCEGNSDENFYRDAKQFR